MIHQRSLEAYRAIRDNGLLKKLNWQIYDFLFQDGPRTTRDITDILRIRDNGTTSGRITYLKDLGVIAELGKKTCETTGMTVSLWGVTARIPVIEKKKKKAKCSHCGGSGVEPEPAPLKNSFKDVAWKKSLFE